MHFINKKQYTIVKSIFRYFIILFFLFFSCDNSSKEKSTIIATVGEKEITVDAFRSFYTFDVNFGLDSSGYNALRDELLFYIDQIKAQKKAKKDGLMQDSIFIRSYEWEKKQAMLRQLYREKISKNISVTEKETRNLFRKGQVQVRFRHLFFKSFDEASQAYSALSRGNSFDELALQVFKDDSLARSGGKLDWIKLSDLDEELSDSIYVLPARIISHPLKSKWGYHIIEVLDKKLNPIISEADYQKSLPALKKKIKQQKSQDQSLQYISHYIGQLNPQLVPEMFFKVWNITIPKSEQEKSKLTSKIELGPNEIEMLHQRLRSDLNRPFVVYKNGQITLNAFLKGIEKIPLSHKFTFKSRRDLSNHIGRWIRDELLLAEAYSENLDKHDRVIAETNRFIEEQSYYYYQSIISDTMKVSQSVIAYFKQKGSANHNTMSSLAKYHTLQEWKFELSKKILNHNLRDIKTDIWIDERVLQEETKKVNWDNKIRMFMIRKPS